MYLPAMIVAGSLAAPALTPTAVNYATPPTRLSPPAQTAPQDAELSVLTYNIHGLPWPLTKGRGAALRQIGRELGEMRAAGRQPDIVLIQEGFGADVKDLIALSGYRYSARGPSRGANPKVPKPEGAKGFRRMAFPQYGEGWGKLTNSGLYILSDRPILGVQSTPFRYCAGLDCLANKGVMLVHVAVPGAPDGIDILNTHMNSRGASRAPKRRTLAAHNLQLDELMAFVADSHVSDRPLLVGGDFNIRNAPDRYNHRADKRPFTVVAEYCNAPDAGCAGETPDAAATPWLRSQDLQAFTSRGGGVAVKPLEIETLFGPGPDGKRLSDHSGYLVRYRLSWNGVTLAPTQVASVEP